MERSREERDEEHPQAKRRKLDYGAEEGLPASSVQPAAGRTERRSLAWSERSVEGKIPRAGDACGQHTESEYETESCSSSSSSSCYTGDVFGCWETLHKLCSGNNGKVYVARLEDDSQDLRVALKVETRKRNSHLLNEVRCMHDLRAEPGFPRALDSGVSHGKRWLAMDLLGPSLRSVTDNYKFEESVILTLADQMLTRLEALHRHRYVHLSVKPDNFCLNTTPNGDVVVYLIDFGRCEEYVDPDGKHIAFGKNKGGPYSRWYHSANALLGKRQSRRDDMISLAYTFVYLYEGEDFVDWREGLRDPTTVDVHEQYKDDLPFWLLKVLRHTAQLGWTETPDYGLVRRLIRSRLSPEGARNATEFLCMVVRRHFERMNR
eukprot:RCo012423